MRLLLVPALLAFTLSCTKAPDAPAPVAPTATPAEVPDVRASEADRACAADAECTLATEDCCGCTSLGKQIGVRADRLAMLAKRREPICAATSCAAAMSEDPTCSATKAVCRAGVCVADVPAAPKPVPTEPIPPG